MLATRHTRFSAIRAKLEGFMPRAGWRAWLYEFLLFGFKQGWACLFGGLLLALLFATHLFYPAGAPLSRYDFLTLSALAIQLGMLALRLETLEEAKVILAFHVVGTVMELFKTALGSWEYPEASLLRLGGVPLFSGFMYAAVGSYIARIWRIFDFRFSGYPHEAASVAAGGGDLCQFLRASLAARCPARPFRADRGSVPQDAHLVSRLARGSLDAAAAGLVSGGAVHLVCREPGDVLARVDLSRSAQWLAMVHWGKLGAWYLLMYISFVLVALVHRPAARTSRSSGLSYSPADEVS